MDLRCDEVWREISNYIDNDIDPALRLVMTKHFGECKRCKAVLDGMRNVVSVYGDERIFTPPRDFHIRLYGRLADQVEGPKGSWRGWLIAIGLSGAMAASFYLVASHAPSEPRVRAEMSQPARQIQQQLVAVVDSGKLFHDPRCPLIQRKYHLVTPEEAIREGYTPCTRCLGDDLRRAQNPRSNTEVAKSQ